MTKARPLWPRFLWGAEPMQQSIPWRALRAALSLPGLVLAGSMVGFGGFAHDAGWNFLEVVLATTLIWALPAQVILIGSLASGAGLAATLAVVSISSIRLLPMVCSLLPQLRREGTRLLTLVAASHYVAQTVWILGLLNVPKVEREERMPFFFWMANLTILLSLVGCYVGYELAGQLPRPLATALLMLTPISFLLSTAATATRFDTALAFALGLALLPVVHVASPYLGLATWDLLITGLLAGVTAFVAGQLRERRAA